MKIFPTVLLPLLLSLNCPAVVRTVTELVTAIESAPTSQSTTIELAEATFQLSEPLQLKSKIHLRGAGIGKTIITHAPDWKGNPASLPDPELNFRKFDKTGYLVHLTDKAEDIEISHLTLTGPQLHGAVYGWNNSRLHLHHLRLEDFLYSGIRTYSTSEALIEHCTFVDTGQRWQKGKPGLTGGITGGAIFVIWIKDSEIAHNRFLRIKTAPNEHFYGVKGRQGKRLNIHHNTIEANFAIEFPFENDQNIEIHHNICRGVISIPKHKGGPIPDSGRTFHIHHNYFTTSYAIEFPRNGVEISHNLFDFPLDQDGGNLISAFGGEPSPGPASFHNNLVSNPGRGVMWMERAFDQLEVRNNHIITRTTATPRTEGLFGFDENCDFNTIVIRDNIVECRGQSRPLFRNLQSGQARVSNNKLINVSETDRYQNSLKKRLTGPQEPLKFLCGVEGELSIDGWQKSLIPYDSSSKSAE